jgi:uncharacterized protein (TIGR02284 family)
MDMVESMIEALNDLVKINNDRIAGYEKAIEETAGLDIDLKAIFRGMVDQSLVYKKELTDLIQRSGGEAEDSTTSSGKIYMAWMQIKSSMTEHDRHSILSSCEFGEDAAQRAYEAALTTESFLNEEARKLVEEQKSALKKSHDLIRAQRDAHKLLPK